MMRQAVTTLVMHTDARRVLMGRRSGVGAFPNQLVFPGGKIDEADRVAAQKLALAGPRHLDDDERIRRVAASRELFEETGLEVSDLSAMFPLSRWVTPAGYPVRFDTWFYILEVPRGQAPVTDGHELTEVMWVDPAQAVEAHFRGEIPLMFPTLAHLGRLAEFGENWREWPRDAATSLEPVHSVMAQRDDGSYVARIPQNMGFSITEVAHRRFL